MRSGELKSLLLAVAVKRSYEKWEFWNGNLEHHQKPFADMSIQK